MRDRAYRNRTNRHHDGKQPFPDEHSARAAAAMSELRYGKPMTAYRCENCGKWHIGHTLQRQPGDGP